ncbi:F-box domain protein [Talaromyces proteolyticus]|uniref:F-box domain protein n=1 Tax=Talaromyces proteolyticus TaxID=1131652 RepID=A0AAD4KUT4_9EURO|nr:F-box domain protein [Talaromyces proteolyticus]KAH8701638.1 F-box domain protein [Talaromyces proteolyticus]
MTSPKTRPTLEKVPTEILDDITTLLQFGDICSLRVVSRTIAAKCVHGKLKKYFANKTVEWTSTAQVQEFVQLTKPQWMGCFLQHLTIVGISPASTASSNQILLGNALDNLRLNSVHGGLQSIVLQVRGRDKKRNIISSEKVRDWMSIWMTASRTFEIVCRALIDSALPIQKLDIFGSIPRCSLACNSIAQVLDYTDLSKSLNRLKSLTLSLSHQVVEEAKRGSSESLPSDKSCVGDIWHLIKMCHQLESLELHWYNLHSVVKLNEVQREDRLFFTQVVQLDHLSQLRHFCLDGICTDEYTLLSFLKQAPQLCSVRMEDVDLKAGKFAPVFSYLTNNMPHLGQLYLDDLFESRLICFDGPGEPNFPSSATNGPNKLIRIGNDCQQPIRYRLMKGHSLGSAQGLKYIRRKRLLYGPPDEYIANVDVIT